MAKFAKLLLGIALLGMLVTGCGGEEGEAVASLFTFSPQYDANFSTNGQFNLGAVVYDADSNSIELTDPDQVEFAVDSVKQAYTITVTAVVFNLPSADDLAVGLLLDSSGSMDWNDPNDVRQDAAKDFINILAANNTDHMASVADFGSSATGDDYYFRLLQDFTNVSNTTDLFAAIDMVEASGGTPMYTGLRRDLEHTDSSALVPASNFSRHLLVLTDGDDNASYPEDTLGAIIDLSLATNIPVCVIGLGSGYSEANLRRLASETGCYYAHASDAGGLNAIYNGLGVGFTQGFTQITAVFDQVPGSGTVIYTTITVNSGGESASATVVFDIP